MKFQLKPGNKIFSKYYLYKHLYFFHEIPDSSPRYSQNFNLKLKKKQKQKHPPLIVSVFL